MHSPDGKATDTATTFSRTCRVAIHIDAAPDVVRDLMTDAAKIPAWNSTVVSLAGTIALNEKIKLVSTQDTGRTFTLTVSTLQKPTTMVWEDGFAPMFKGVRTYQFSPADGGTVFAMEEVFSGVMLPLIGGSLPDFKPTFEQFAADLKQAAEASV